MPSKTAGHPCFGPAWLTQQLAITDSSLRQLACCVRTSRPHSSTEEASTPYCSAGDRCIAACVPNTTAYADHRQGNICRHSPANRPSQAATCCARHTAPAGCEARRLCCGISHRRHLAHRCTLESCVQPLRHARRLSLRVTPAQQADGPLTTRTEASPAHHTEQQADSQPPPCCRRCEPVPGRQVPCQTHPALDERSMAAAHSLSLALWLPGAASAQNLGKALAAPVSAVAQRRQQCASPQRDFRDAAACSNNT